MVARLRQNSFNSRQAFLCGLFLFSALVAGRKAFALDGNDNSANKKSACEKPLMAPAATPDLNLVRKHLDALWIETLRQYSGHEKLLAALGHFKSVCHQLQMKYPSADFLLPYTARAGEIHDSLEIHQIRYRNLEDLGLSLIRSLDGRSKYVLRKLGFMDEVLNQLKQVSTLTTEESQLHDFIKDLIVKTGVVGKAATDQNIGESFMSQLPGPLSRRAIARAYPPSKHGEEIDWSKLVKDLREGKLNDFLVSGRLKKFSRVFTKKPPPKVLAQKGDPKKAIPQKISFILVNLSGSTEQKNQDVLRNALALSYVDLAQLEVVTGKGEHIVYVMAVDAHAQPPERLENPQQAQEYFDRVRKNPIPAGGSDGFSESLVEVYKRIAEHQKANGEVDRANIFLLTDPAGPIQFEKIEKARKEIDPSVEIVLNAISVGDLNKEVQKLVSMQGGQGEGKLGRLYHQHIDPLEVGALLNAELRLRGIEKSALNFDPNGDANLTSEALSRLKQHFTMLAAKRDADDRLGGADTKDLEKALGNSNAGPGSEPIEELVALFLNSVQSPISEGWTLSVRAAAFRKFISEMASEYKEDSSKILAQIDKAKRKQIADWIGFSK